MTQDINIHLEENHESASIYVVNQIKDLIETRIKNNPNILLNNLLFIL